MVDIMKGESGVNSLWELLLFLKLLLSLKLFVFKGRIKKTEINCREPRALWLCCDHQLYRFFHFAVLYPQHMAIHSWTKTAG